jgi:hypothetical protein
MISQFTDDRRTTLYGLSVYGAEANIIMSLNVVIRL